MPKTKQYPFNKRFIKYKVDYSVMAIEVEVRSFITKEKYDDLLKFFKMYAEFVKEDYQETYYFDSDADLRIQKNNFFSKIWLKKGKIHDDFREEVEIKFKREDFKNLVT